MTDTVLHGALSLITRVDADMRHVWTDTPWLIGTANLGLAMASASGVCSAAPLTAAFFALLLGLVVWLAFGAGTTYAASLPTSRPVEVWPVEAALREAVQLWANEQFEALWEHGLRTSRSGGVRPGHASPGGEAHLLLGPDPRRAVHLQATDEAFVEAQIGLDLKTLGTTVRRSMIVYLRREEEVWRIKLEDFLTKPEDALSGLRAPW